MFSVKGFGCVWNAEKNEPLAVFVDGVFSTSDKEIADKLKALGFEVTEEGAEKKLVKTAGKVKE